MLNYNPYAKVYRALIQLVIGIATSRLTLSYALGIDDINATYFISFIFAMSFQILILFIDKIVLNIYKDDYLW